MGRRTALVVVVAVACIAVGTAHASFPGANGRIAFVSDRDGNLEIYSMDPDGSDQIRLTTSSGNEWNPTWSPEGRRIAYDRDAYVHVLADDGSYDVRIATCFYDSQPSWSPDGAHHVLYRQFGKTPYLLTRQVGGIDEEQLEEATIGVHEPEWSPDGHEIAFVNERYGTEDGTSGGIWLMDSDGTDAREVTASANGDAAPSWHPSSQRIAFAGRREGQLDIYSVDPDGAGLVRLTDHPAADSDPAWSPDGTQIAFVSDRDGDDEVFVMNADGTNVRQITNIESDESEVDWGVVPSDPLPGPPEGPTPDCVEDEIERSITLELKAHLKAVGRYSVDDDDPRCGFDLRIQRRTGGRWKNVVDSWSLEDGRYVARIPDRTGRYRARLRRSEMGFYTDRYRDVCFGATSSVRVHRH